MVGGRASIAARAAAGVSPVRTATVMGGGASPSSEAMARISARGRSRLSWMSTARAFSGET